MGLSENGIVRSNAENERAQCRDAPCYYRSEPLHGALLTVAFPQHVAANAIHRFAVTLQLRLRDVESGRQLELKDYQQKRVFIMTTPIYLVLNFGNFANVLVVFQSSCRETQDVTLLNEKKKKDPFLVLLCSYCLCCNYEY